MKNPGLCVAFMMALSLSAFSQEIDILTPQGGQSYFTGDTLLIHWASHRCAGLVDITLLRGDWVTQVIAKGAPNVDDDLNANVFKWRIPHNLVTAKEYKIQIQTVGKGSSCLAKSRTFTIERTSITVLSPNGGETWQCAQPYPIEWQKVGNVGSTVRVLLLKGGATVHSVIAIGSPTDLMLPDNLSPASDYKIRIESTADQSIKDDSDRNFTIRCDRSLPDLIVNNMQLESTSLVVNQSGWVKVWAKNNGAGHAPPTKLRLIFQPVQQTVFFDVPPLAPGQISGPFTATRVFNQAGTYTIWASADEGNDAIEADENNNRLSRSLNVSDEARPDLHISGISWNPPEVNKYVHITVTVANKPNCGMAPATKLRFKIGGETNPPVYNIPPLGPGQNHSIGRGFTPTKAGNYIITATADADNDAPNEKNENDNSKQETIIVR